MRMAAPNETAKRTQKDQEERETACKERENGKKQRQHAGFVWEFRGEWNGME